MYNVHYAVKNNINDFKGTFLCFRSIFFMFFNHKCIYIGFLGSQNPGPNYNISTFICNYNQNIHAD